MLFGYRGRSERSKMLLFAAVIVFLEAANREAHIIVTNETIKQMQVRTQGNC